MFRTRLLSGIVLILIALVTIITGGALLFGVLLVISLIGMRELYRAVGLGDRQFIPLTAACMGGAAAYYAAMYLRAETMMTGIFSLILICLLTVYVFLWPRYQAMQVMAGFFGILYVAAGLSCLYRIRIMENGVFTVWLAFISAWGCDTCAYCAGMLFGRHKMCPRLSPKKTIEGAVGGVIGAAVLGAVYALAAGKAVERFSAPVWEYVLICAAGALLSMVGDLAASAIKRDCGIKDYGKLIPGHGGILDRFDSVLFTAPVIWVLAKALLH